MASSVAVFDIDNLDKGYETCCRSANGRESPRASDASSRVSTTRTATEIWFSVWNSKDQESAIVIVDDKTRKPKHVIRDKRLVTPTGKFNVYNTRNDVY